jgi:glutathione S-transferase
MADLTIYLGNKNYSSWSLRPWLVLKRTTVAFEEVVIPLYQPTSKETVLKYSPSGRVPALRHGDVTIWDSLAICEYLAEQFHEQHLWPQDVAARAMARSVTAEMHSSFSGLRSAMSMNIRMHLPGRGRTPEAQGDIGRISEIWEECLSRFGHHQFLFGEFSIADAFFAPVVMRFRTYGVALAPALQAYCDRMQAHPAIARWVSEALAETETAPLHDDEIRGKP